MGYLVHFHADRHGEFAAAAIVSLDRHCQVHAAAAADFANSATAVVEAVLLQSAAG